MVFNEALQTIIECILSRQLGKSIAQLENYLYTFAQPQAAEQLTQIKADYQLMSSYWQQGYDDPQRKVLYDQLLRRMYVLTMNVYIRYDIRNSSYVLGIYNRARNSRNDWSPSTLQRELESFVSDVAMLELEPEHVRQQKQKAVYEAHQQLMADLFDYIWTSRLWTTGVAEAFERMLLSPTIDSNDQQLLVSAITVSLLNFFGINKFRLLVRVYQHAVDEAVRQRALIDWVLCLRADVCRLYTEVHELVKEVTGDERCLNELAELQMQMVYCLRAESDTRIIQSEIMPELMKNNNLRVTRNGVEEVEDDPMEDVLHPELSEQRMEKLEESVRRMVDMQRQGSDIYFGGFSQMKRFPFFQTVANWFVPFYMQHTAVSSIIDKVRGKSFLKTILVNGAFCDSDKYSFVFAYEATVSRLPESMRTLLDRGEATLVGGELAMEELSSPAYIRRAYLQNIYRFYKVYPNRNEFLNPFADDANPRYLFFANPVFQHTGLEQKFGELVAFFVKHKAYDAAKLTLRNYREDARDAQFYLLNGNILMRTHDAGNAGLSAVESYARALMLEPDNERAWAGYARALFGLRLYEEALKYYRKLLGKHPDSQNYQLNAAVCLTNMNEHEEALKLLYKLNYESPDNVNVNRVLAWALVGARKYQQADKIYQDLLSAEQPEADDLLNAAYCCWFSGRVADAAQLFRKYAKQDGVSFDAETEFFHNEAAVISYHGIGEIEVRMMVDLVMLG